VAVQGHAPEHGSLLPWIAAPKPARNDEPFKAGGRLGQMRLPCGLGLLAWEQLIVQMSYGAPCTMPPGLLSRQGSGAEAAADGSLVAEHRRHPAAPLNVQGCRDFRGTPIWVPSIS